MQVQVVNAPVIFLPGTIIILNDSQSSNRAQSLKRLKGDKFEVTREIQFKIGERFGVTDKMNLKRFANLHLLDEDEKK